MYGEHCQSGAWAAGAEIRAGLTPNTHSLGTSASAVLELDSLSCRNSCYKRQERVNQIPPQSLGQGRLRWL